MKTLEIRTLTVGYGRKPIWKNLSLTASAGERLVLLGENGSGKTTLLRAIQGSIPVKEGSIWIDGVDLASLTVRRRASLVTTMPQEIPAEAGLTGADYLEMGLYIRKGPFAGLTEKEKESIASMAAHFGIGDLLEQDLAQMSAGQRQMVSLLRAAVQDTPVLLLDEPVSALDWRHADLLFAMLKKLSDEGKCILMVLHDPTLALRHGTRLLCLGGGCILSDLTPAEVSPEETERALRQLYPDLRLHRDPLFCYPASESSKSLE